MIISVINRTTMPDVDVQAAIRAVNIQIERDFFPYWSIGATLRLDGASEQDPKKNPAANLRGDAILYLEDEIGDRLRTAGGEVGTTTGRPRRCGWLDLVGLKYAVRLNGMTGLAITKLDVLSGIDTLRVCVRYRGAEGAQFDEFPYHQSVLHHASAEYDELPGFEEDITGARSEEDLPAAAREYLRYIADFVGVPVVLIGVGPGREQVIWVGDEENRALEAA